MSSSPNNHTQYPLLPNENNPSTETITTMVDEEETAGAETTDTTTTTTLSEDNNSDTTTKKKLNKQSASKRLKRLLQLPNISTTSTSNNNNQNNNSHSTQQQEQQSETPTPTSGSKRKSLKRTISSSFLPFLEKFSPISPLSHQPPTTLAEQFSTTTTATGSDRKLRNVARNSNNSNNDKSPSPSSSSLGITPTVKRTVASQRALVLPNTRTRSSSFGTARRTVRTNSRATTPLLTTITTNAATSTLLSSSPSTTTPIASTLSLSPPSSARLSSSPRAPSSLSSSSSRSRSSSHRRASSRSSSSTSSSSSSSNSNRHRSSSRSSRHHRHYHHHHARMYHERRDKEDTLSIILLGAGEGGKATIYKQIQNMYNNDFEDVQSRYPYASVIHHNAVMSMYAIVSYIRKLCAQQPLIGSPRYHQDSSSNNNSNSSSSSSNTSSSGVGEDDEQDHWIELERLLNCVSQETKDCFLMFSSFDDYERRLNCTLTPELVSSIDYLWNHEPLVRFIYHHHRHEKFQLYESAEYWFEHLYRIAQTDYVPSMQDIMRLRIKTTGILESKVRDSVSGTNVSMILMGSQRNERKKWITIIRDRKIGAILFVIALSEYNQTLYENDVTNRLYESICVFSEMLNSNCLSDVPVYLFLNKCDVFTEKLRGERYSDLSQVFPNLPSDLRKDELKHKGVYLLPKSYDSCVLVNWEENASPRANRMTDTKFEIKTTLVRTRTATYASLLDWKPTSNSRECSTASRISTFSFNDLPLDVMGHMCSYLDIKDLCRVSQVNSLAYMVSGQDHIWRSLYFKKLFGSRECVQQNISNITVTEEMVGQIYEQEVLLQDHHSQIQMAKWKCFVKYTSQTYYQKNINFLLEELFQSTDRRDIKVFLTDATDAQGMQCILSKIVPTIVARNKELNETKTATVRSKRTVLSKLKKLLKR